MATRIILGSALILGALCTSAYSAENVGQPVSTNSAKLVEKFDAGDYWSVGSEGLDVLKIEPDNNELRMIVANSLAWTSRYADAIMQYQMLVGTPLSDRAMLGLANVYRWSGRPDLASPLYQKILTSQPDNPDALDGMNIINHELLLETNVAPDKKIEPPVSIGSAKLKGKFDAGDYWPVGSEGLDFLKSEPDNNELRMMVADSLAWTGRYADAIMQYQMLMGTPLSDRAMLGLANVYRWSGRADMASPLYQEILSSQPDNPDAVDGLNMVNRELRARTDVMIGSKSDSNSVIQNGTEIKHYWRGGNPAIKYALSLNTSRYTLTPLVTDQREINFSLENVAIAMAPKLDLSVQQEPVGKAYYSLRLKLDDAPELHITVGHVNWGSMAFQPQALLDELAATQLGVDGSLIMRPGTISAVYNDYQVSDGNRLQDSNIQLFPAWRPLGADFRYYIGLFGRFAKRNVSTYWSPETGYLSAAIGFTNEWSMSNGAYSVYGQRGFGVGGEALDSYNMGLAAKRYIGRDWAASLSAGLLKNQRADAYHSKYLTFGVERFW